MDQVEIFGEQDGYATISIRRNNDSLLLDNEGLNSFNIVYEDVEILILAFVDEEGKGMFEATNLPSAIFADMNSISLEVGDELAQIDWDGVTAHVDWVQVDNVILLDDVPQIQVNNFPLEGCSGGGVFFNGTHVGINWMRNIKMNQDTGEITGRYSTIALNSSGLIEVSQ